MNVVITIAILIVSVLLVLIVLVQNSKGGGLSSGFSSSNQIMGAPKTADFLEKATWTLAGALIVLCVISTAVMPRHTTEESELKGRFQTETAAPSGFETEQAPVEATQVPDSVN